MSLSKYAQLMCLLIGLPNNLLIRIFTIHFTCQNQNNKLTNDQSWGVISFIFVKLVGTLHPPDYSNVFNVTPNQHSTADCKDNAARLKQMLFILSPMIYFSSLTQQNYSYFAGLKVQIFNFLFGQNLYPQISLQDYLLHLTEDMFMLHPEHINVCFYHGL